MPYTYINGQMKWVEPVKPAPQPVTWNPAQQISLGAGNKGFTLNPPPVVPTYHYQPQPMTWTTQPWTNQTAWTKNVQRGATAAQVQQQLMPPKPPPQPVSNAYLQGYHSQPVTWSMGGLPAMQMNPGPQRTTNGARSVSWNENVGPLYNNPNTQVDVRPPLFPTPSTVKQRTVQDFRNAEARTGPLSQPYTITPQKTTQDFRQADAKSMYDYYTRYLANLVPAGASSGGALSSGYGSGYGYGSGGGWGGGGGGGYSSAPSWYLDMLSWRI